MLGIVRSQAFDDEIRKAVSVIQNDLFIIGADLASPSDIAAPRIKPHKVRRIEKTIDKFLEELEPLKEFILPTGTKGGQYLHLARTISRRAERSIVRLKREEKINENVLKYVNRLSDLLFVMARIENRRAGFEETFVNFGN